MDERMIAYCGLVCTECPAYRATQAGDEDLARRTAVQWSRDYGIAVSVENVWCDGCVAQGRKCAHCAECEMRACGRARGVAHCGACEEYDTCGKLADFLAAVPQARKVLDGVRGG